MAEEQLAQEETGTNDIGELSPAETKAREAGWVPVEEWRGDEADWVDYKDFNLRGEFMKRINDQSGIINHLQNKVSDRDKAIADMAAFQNQISEREYKKALKDLQSQKAELLEADDFNGVVEIDEEISELKNNKPAPTTIEDIEAQEGIDGVPQEIVDWLGKPEQSWYHTNAMLRGAAEGISGELLAENPNITPTEMIRKVDAKLRKDLPEHFKSVAPVDTGGEFNGNPQKRGGSLPGWNSLTDEQKAVANRFERVGAMTKKEYIKSLVELGEIE